MGEFGNIFFCSCLLTQKVVDDECWLEFDSSKISDCY